MPNVGPPVVPAFLSAVAACTWSGGALVDAAGARYKCHTVSGSAWTLSTTSGLWVSFSDSGLLHGASANTDGSFTDASGNSWWLTVGGEWAVAVAK